MAVQSKNLKEITELTTGDRVGPYVIDSRLSNGGMAYVFRATTPGSRIWALKISRLSGETSDQAVNQATLKEAELLQKMKHRRIVQIFPVEDLDRRERGRGEIYRQRALNIRHLPWFFVQEYLSGGTLGNHVKKVGMLTLGEGANIVGNVAVGLDYMHFNGYAHNDVKPENVMFRSPVRFGEKFDPVLIDFGIAANAKRNRGDAGSTFIMAPERLRITKGMDAPETPYDTGKADVWSLGILLYYVLTQKLPFPALQESTLTSQILNHTPTSMRQFNPNVPEVVDEFILTRCMAKEPVLRPTMKDVIQFLQPYGSGERGLARTVK